MNVIDVFITFVDRTEAHRKQKENVSVTIPNKRILCSLNR